MIRQDLIMVTRTGVQDFAPNTVPQLNRPNPFNNASLFERTRALKDVAVVGYLGVAGKRVFDEFTSGIARRTGRTDIQSRINRAKKNIGNLSKVLIGIGFFGAGGGGAAVAELAVSTVVDNIAEQKQRVIDRGEAEFRTEARGNIRNNSRSGQ